MSNSTATRILASETLDLLTRIEWAGDVAEDGKLICPSCEGERTFFDGLGRRVAVYGDGHKPDCDLARVRDLCREAMERKGP